MANYVSTDLDSIQESMRKLPAALRGEVVDRGLEKAGEIIIKHAQGSIRSKKKNVPTGQLAESLRSRRIRDQNAIEVLPRGSRKRVGKEKHGIRKSMARLFLEYGSRKMQGTRWASEAAASAADDVAEAVVNIYDEIIETLI